MTNETTLPELSREQFIELVSMGSAYDLYEAVRQYGARCAEQATATLRAELEQGRADADRYKWLQQNYAFGDGYVYVDEALSNGEADTQLSAAIDAARGAQ